MTSLRPIGDWPTIRVMRTGETIIGLDEGFAIDQYRAGWIPVHGLTVADPEAVSRLRISDDLDVSRAEKTWEVHDPSGLLLGTLKWRPGDNGRRYAQDGGVILYPDSGALHVDRLWTLGGSVTNVQGRVRNAAK